MRRLACVVVLALGFCGCQNLQSWSYRPEPRSPGAPVLDRTVVVLPFEDNRENINRNRMAFYLIPLMPYGWVDYETPEGVQMHLFSGLWQFRPADDFARAVAQEIENARVFRETFVESRPSAGDLVLTGQILSTRYKGKLLTYGLSLYGPVLWLFGLPAGTVSNDLVIKLNLSRSLSGPPLWTYTIEERAGKTNWVYAMRSDFPYADLLKRGMTGAVESLRNAARDMR